MPLSVIIKDSGNCELAYIDVACSVKFESELSIILDRIIREQALKAVHDRKLKTKASYDVSEGRYCGFSYKKITENKLDRWVVVDRHHCNPIPGAMMSKTARGARNMIDCYVAAGGRSTDEFCKSGVDVDMFHALIRISNYKGE